MDAMLWARAGALLMFLTVALGAFAAHALKETLGPDAKAWFETGVRYQAYHGLALFAVAWLASRGPSRGVEAAGWCFLLGTLLFSGSLYGMSLTGWRKLGMVTPAGGVLFLAGWASLLAALRRG